MAAADAPGIVDPEQAWARLEADPKAALVDVRTQAEWAFVGLPDLDPLGKRPELIEWTRFPDMARNAAFLDELDRSLAASGAETLMFLCRSGGRSHHAAVAALDHFARTGRRIACLNVVEGFEGDLDAEGRRGRLGGWKARGLPWRQS